ncbi:MAG: large-conductance mechanosensitive channel protein MscL [Muribaculaceae bacterium]|nr:large-conductance mechanosensitive channel protein MscL [Muribaculaceae bacterium]
MGKFLTDFKEFALKGNVIDMAVGVIVGGAFGKIVASLVNDIIMPVMSLITGGEGYKNLKYVIKDAAPATADGVAAVEEVAVNYGIFIQNIVDFLIIAISIFVALRVMMKFKKKEEEAPAPAPEPSAEEKLLTEIRDLLKNQESK